MVTFLEFSISGSQEIGFYLFFLIPIFIVIGLILIIVGAILNYNDNKKFVSESELNENSKGKKTIKTGLYFLAISGVLSLIVYTLCS